MQRKALSLAAMRTMGRSPSSGSGQGHWIYIRMVTINGSIVRAGIGGDLARMIALVAPLRLSLMPSRKRKTLPIYNTSR